MALTRPTNPHSIQQAIPNLMILNGCSSRLELGKKFARERWAHQCMRIIALRDRLEGDEETWDWAMPWLAVNLTEEIMAELQQAKDLDDTLRRLVEGL